VVVVKHVCGVAPADLGPFLLGQLAPDAAAAVAERVAACPSCSVQVERLRPVVAALARSSPPPATDLDEERSDADGRRAGPAEAAPRPRIARLPDGAPAAADEPGRRPSRRRRLLAAAALAVVLAVGGGVVVLTWDAGAHRIALSGADGMSASVALRARSWGTQIAVDAHGLRPGSVYGVWLERRSGGRLPAGSFRTDPAGAVSIVLGAAEPIEASGAVGVTLLPDRPGGTAVDVLRAPVG
jgi:hypothetical protein